MTTTEHYDAVIVGSGFGGSVMAYRLAEAGKRVCVLERGRAYPPGSFPRSPREMKKAFWDPSAGLQGMFNVWSFKQIGALVASGLGGGSLIYANVLLRKDERWFIHEDPVGSSYESWPVSRADLDPHYDRVEKILAPTPYPVAHAPYDATLKTRGLRQAADALAARAPTQVRWEPAPLAVAFANAGKPPALGERLVEPFPNYHDRPRDTCRLCGECDIGCNHGSKNSLDYNYLTLAKRSGAEIRTRTEVRGFKPRSGGGYEVQYVEHRDDVPYKELQLRTMTCDRLVLAAGTLGSTFLLLKARDKHRELFRGLSPRLGHAFSGNGDMLGFVMRSKDPKTGQPRDLSPCRGPVITGAVRFADELDGGGARGRGFYVEDAGFPEFVHWISQGVVGGGVLRRALAFVRSWLREHLHPGDNNVSVDFASLFDDTLTQSSLPLLAMGRARPNGRLTFEDDRLALEWKYKDTREYIARVRSGMQDIAAELNAHYRNDPLKLLRRVITVHPLGGCPMGKNQREGVVDDAGQVFNMPGLYVIDGAMLPGPVGPNPSLTIAACADRAADRLLGV